MSIKDLTHVPGEHVVALLMALESPGEKSTAERLDAQIQFARSAKPRSEPALLRVATLAGCRSEFLSLLAEMEWATALELRLLDDKATGPAVTYLINRFESEKISVPLFCKPPSQGGSKPSCVVGVRLEEKFSVLGYGDWEELWETEFLHVLGWLSEVPPLKTWWEAAHIGPQRSGKYLIPRFVLNLVAELSRERGRQSSALKARKRKKALSFFPPAEGLRSKRRKAVSSEILNWIRIQGGVEGSRTPEPEAYVMSLPEIPISDTPEGFGKPPEIPLYKTARKMRGEKNSVKRKRPPL